MKTEIQNGTCLPPEAYIRLAKLADHQPKFRSSVYPKAVLIETRKEKKK
jgi:hypothetical protein